MDGDGPRFGAMIALVAVVVATVILVFFGIGYALGRLFLSAEGASRAGRGPALAAAAPTTLATPWASSPCSASRTTG